MSRTLIVKRTIKESDEPLKKMQLFKAVPKSLMHQTFEKILEYLDSQNQIAYDKQRRIIWIAADNPIIDDHITSRPCTLTTF